MSLVHLGEPRGSQAPGWMSVVGVTAVSGVDGQDMSVAVCRESKLVELALKL